jgi:SNF2 family DNA or RNA helicase
MWRVQIKKFSGETAKIFYGSDPRPSDLISLLGDNKPKWAIFNYDILGKRLEYNNEYEGKDGSVIKGDIVIRYPWMELINASQFDIIGVDEAHYIKNIDSNRSKAVRTLQTERVVFLTATPVMNRPRELWPLLNIITPDLFPSYETFMGTYEYDGRARNSAELLELLKPLMIRRLKKDVVKDLPPINRIYEFYELSDKAQHIYNKVMEGIFERMIELGGHPDSQEQVTSILTQIMRLKQICAIDKMNAIAELATDLYDARENGDASKVLVFSQFVPVARGIGRRLGQEALIVTGETSQEKRDELVYQFQTDENVHFMVATKGVLSEGKDLTKAAHVIFADLFWTPAAHEQAEGRAYGRLSELHSINSYYCTSKQSDGEESIEDWIQQILARKLAVIEEVVDGVEGSRNSSMSGELLERIKQELFSRKR